MKEQNYYLGTLVMLRADGSMRTKKYGYDTRINISTLEDKKNIPWSNHAPAICLAREEDEKKEMQHDKAVDLG